MYLWLEWLVIIVLCVGVARRLADREFWNILFASNVTLENRLLGLEELCFVLGATAGVWFYWMVPELAGTVVIVLVGLFAGSLVKCIRSFMTQKFDLYLRTMYVKEFRGTSARVAATIAGLFHLGLLVFLLSFLFVR